MRGFSSFSINGPFDHCPRSPFESISFHPVIRQTGFHTSLIWNHLTGITRTRGLKGQSVIPATMPFQAHSRQASAKFSSLSQTAPRWLFKLLLQMSSGVILDSVVFATTLLCFLQGWTFCLNSWLAPCFPCCLQCRLRISALGIQVAEYWSACLTQNPGSPSQQQKNKQNTKVPFHALQPKTSHRA